MSWNYGGELYQDEFKPRTNKVEATNDLALLPYAEGGTPGGKRTIASLFNNLQYEYGDWLTLDGGLRYDRYRLEGETGMTLYRRDRFYSSLVGGQAGRGSLRCRSRGGAALPHLRHRRQTWPGLAAALYALGQRLAPAGSDRNLHDGPPPWRRLG